MCEPLSIVAATAAIASAGVSVYSSVQQGKHGEEVAEYNARVNENQAKEVLNRARFVENEERQKATQLRSQQRAALAANGVNVEGGTAGLIQEDTLKIGEINAMRVRQNAQSQSDALNQQATLNRFEGENAKYQGTMGAIGAGLQGVAATAGAASKAGMFNKGDTLLTSPAGSGGAVADKWYKSGSGYTFGQFNGGSSNMVSSFSLA